MVESEAKELSEDIMLEAVVFGQNAYKDVLKTIVDLAEEAAKDPWELIEIDATKEDKIVSEKFKESVLEAYNIKNKKDRQEKLKKINQSLEVLSEETEIDTKKLSSSLNKLQKKLVREKILTSKIRIDGRKIDEVRKINCNITSRAMTALFTRGETQAIAALKLGTSEDEQMIDSLEGLHKEKFMLHYNFPPFSVGEAGRMGGTGRREIGHGKLAWRAVHPILPSVEGFPYTIRIVSEITESNGSSSMATVCASSLALMDAGVPIKKQIAGIAMGLIKEEENFIVLSDILGDEDHLGDMDFKVAGTKDGITSLQMDIKVDSITSEIMSAALKQAKKGRILILKEMDKIIKKPNKELNEFAPKMQMLKIDKDKIREVIGSGGKVIREIVELSEAKVDIDDEGNIKVSSNKKEAIKTALKMIHDIVDEPENGKYIKEK